ncbi:MAG: alpha-galactosidase [Candidatus Hydrogenedentes bacterium]|nr:alpha-galactosidase [Candidatus Hydrogenedentota bacterium]
MRTIALCLAALCALSAAHAQLFSRPKEELRTISAGAYFVSIQKNGKINVLRNEGNTVFELVQPTIWFDGEEAPEPISIAGHLSGRGDVSDALGKGQGMTLESEGCTWSIRVYPSEPYFTVQVAFTNTKKVPVLVKMLSPWTAGDGKRGGFSLGPGTTDVSVLEGGKTFPGDTGVAGLRTGAGTCLWNFAALNQTTNQSLVTGFLAYTTGYGRFRMESPIAEEDGKRFATFAAECIYDPPVIIEPGEKLVSEPLYLAVAEVNAFEGLERYGWAYGAANKISRARPKFLPHGWDSWSTEYRSDINEVKIFDNANALATNLSAFGWNHLAIDDGWQQSLGDWEADAERFPNGMKHVADYIHGKGLTAGLWLAPFKVSADSALAKAHPEWLRMPNELGKQVVGENDRILDITAPGASDWVRDLARKVTQEWGFDAIMEADYVYYLPLAEGYHDASLTRVEVHRLGMEALREGMGDEAFLMSFAPQPITGIFAQGMRIGNDNAPIWRKHPERWPWGCVESLTNAARRYYYTPNVWRPDQDCAFFANDATRERWGMIDQPALTRQESIAWLTGAALTGGVVKIGDRFTSLLPEDIDVMRRVLPVMDRPARPVDLFREQEPRIWVLPVKTSFDEWTVAGIFNWTDAEQITPIDFRELGLASNAFYTVYDFWAETYFGTAEKQVQVSVPPRSVRLLTFRKYEPRPQFLGTNRHFSGGATDFTDLEWREADRTLTGTFNAVSPFEYELRILVPIGCDRHELKCSVPNAIATLSDRVLLITVTPKTNAPVEWSVTFM